MPDSIPMVDVIEVLDVLERLHAHKSLAYGASWRKHGELLSIFANISRKVDRLEVVLAAGSDTPDESKLDTVADLAVYCMLYSSWLLRFHESEREGIPVVARMVEHQILSGHYSGLGLSQGGQHDWRIAWESSYRKLEREVLPGYDHHWDSAGKSREAANMAASAVMWLVLAMKQEPSAYQKWCGQWSRWPDVPRLAQ